MGKNYIENKLMCGGPSEWDMGVDMGALQREAVGSGGSRICKRRVLIESARAKISEPRPLLRVTTPIFMKDEKLL